MFGGVNFNIYKYTPMHVILGNTIYKNVTPRKIQKHVSLTFNIDIGIFFKIQKMRQ